MHALTISEPWASLIVAGAKYVENRTWATKVRGRIAVHAGVRSRYLTPAQLRENHPFAGCVLGTVDVVDCLSLEEIAAHVKARTGSKVLSAAEILGVSEHEYTEGPFCWVLRDPQWLPTPLRVTGRLGLWEWDGEGQEPRAESREPATALRQGALFGVEG